MIERLRAAPRPVKVFVAILALALIVRVAAVGATQNYSLVTDSADYHRHAISISEGDGYPESIIAPGGGPSAFRPPLYPHFMGGVYAVVGPKWNAVRFTQAVLGVIAVALIGLIAFRIWGTRVALTAAGIAAVYPPLIIANAAILVESLFLPLALGAIAAVIEHNRRADRYRWLLTAGALIGLATLTRANGIVLLLPLLLAIWPGRRGLSRQWLAQGGALIGAAVVVMLPWTIRNAVEVDGFVPVASQSGYALAGTYNEAVDDDAVWEPPNYIVGQFEDVFDPKAALTELEIDRKLRARALDFMSENPAYALRVAALNTLRMLDLTGFDHAENVVKFNGIGPRVADIGVVAWYLLAGLALAGALTTLARRAPWWLWTFPPIYLLSVVFIADSASRYRLPIDPLVIMLAACAIVTAYNRSRPAIA